MSHLQSVYISGFKSVASDAPIHMEFCTGVNVISGANGAGKSNVLDAILFCLTAPEKDLRVSKMRGLIHCKGTALEKCATVELSFFIKSEKVVLTAKVFSDSDERKFKIQGKSHTLGETRHWVHTVLGISITAPAFTVLQNTVISFLSKSAAELADILTNVSGTSSLRKEIADFKKFYESVWRASASDFGSELSSLEAELETVREKVRMLRRINEVGGKVLDAEQQIVKLGAAKVYKALDCAQKEAYRLTELREGNQVVINTLQSKAATLTNLLQKALQGSRDHTKSVLSPLLSALTSVKDDLASVTDDLGASEANFKRMSEMVHTTRATLTTKAAVLSEEETLHSICKDKAEVLSNNTTSTITPEEYEEKKRVYDQCKKATLSCGEAADEAAAIFEKKEESLTTTSVESAEKEVEKLTERNDTLSGDVRSARDQLLHIEQRLEGRMRTHPKLGLGVLLESVKVKQAASPWLLALNTCGGKWTVEVCENESQVGTLLDMAKKKRRHIRVWCLSQLPDITMKADVLRKATVLGGILPSMLLDYPGAFKRAVDKLFPHTVFCKTASQVKLILALGVSVVTQDGTVHHAGGNRVTGGYIDTTMNPLALTDTRDKLKVQLQSSDEELAQVKSALEKARYELLRSRTATVEMARVKGTLEQSKRQLHNARREESDALRAVRLAETQLDAVQGVVTENYDEVKRRVALHEKNIGELQAVVAALNSSAVADAECLLRAKDEATCLGEQKRLLEEKFKIEEGKFKAEDITSKQHQAEVKQLRKDFDACEVEAEGLKHRQLALEEELAVLKGMTAQHEAALRASGDSALREEGIAEHKDTSDAVVSGMLRDAKYARMQLLGEKEALEKCSAVCGLEEVDVEKADQLEEVVARKRVQVSQATKWVEALWQGVNDPKLIARGEAEDAKALEHCNRVFSDNLKTALGFSNAELRARDGKVSRGLDVWVEGSELSLFSGGQKTIIALSFLLSVASYHSAPFYLLDEVDAALDESNQNLVASLVTTSLASRQVLCITHHPAFRKKAHKIFHLQNRGNGTVLTRTSAAHPANKKQKQ